MGNKKLIGLGIGVGVLALTTIATVSVLQYLKRKKRNEVDINVLLSEIEDIEDEIEKANDDSLPF